MTQPMRSGSVLVFSRRDEELTQSPPTFEVHEAPASPGGPLRIQRRPLPARQVPISFLDSRDVMFRSPLHAVVEESATGTFTAASYDLELIGEGESEFDALEDLRTQILELFLALREMKENLPPHLGRRLAFLESLAG